MFVKFEKEEIERSIPERFEKIVRLHADGLAVKAGQRSFTYSDLNRAANRIAHAILEKRGQGSEPIALLFEHGIDAVAGIFATLKAGKFYVALEPSFPAERIAALLDDSQAGLIATNNRNADLAQDLAKGRCGLLNVDGIDEAFSCDNPALSLSPDDLAHIMYTSGSTGSPKGTVHTHRTLLQSAMVSTDRMHIGARDRLTLLHPVGFGASKLGLFTSLLSGASLLTFNVKSEGIPRLARWLIDEQITIFLSSPAVFRQLADALVDGEKPPSLRLIYLTGAPVTRPDFDLYKKIFAPEALLEIGLGSTEANMICSYTVSPDFSFPEDGVPAGQPLPGKGVLLLDENGKEVGPDQVGEIAVKSRHLSLGYWRQPQLTRAKFLPDPNGGKEGIYLTGDLGRKLPDGFLIHLGRKDLMVKIRGYPVEIWEIEKSLHLHPGVKEAGVAAWDRAAGEKYLAAYIVPHGKPAPTARELRGFLEEKLPDYMIPSVFMFLGSLPLTNGKLDRKALPKPEDKRPELTQSYAHARNETEQKLVRIWEQVLEVRPVGIHDNFFDLGGHSLAAARVVSGVIRGFQLEIPLQSLFQSPTVAEMAAVITANQGKQLGQTEMESILTELELLTEEEAARLLGNQNETGHEKHPAD
jgi:amino acid adenylation domain-containing protein